MFDHATAGCFGYTHLTGGYPGGQAEYLRVPFADTTHLKVPDGIPDEKLPFLSDILPTGWQAAVQCDIQPEDTVAVWGCGLVEQMTVMPALGRRNDRRGNAALAFVALIGITVLDVVAASATAAAHERSAVPPRDDVDRSGLPRGIEASRGLARRDFVTPPDYRTPGTVAEGLPM